jgi:hypothetical protein
MPPSPRQVSEAFTNLVQTAQSLLQIEPNMPAEDAQLWQDMLEAESQGEPFAVIDRLVHAAVQAEHYAEGVGRYQSDLAERKKRHLRQAEHLRFAVQQFLERLAIPTLVRPTYSASISAGRAHVVPTRRPEEMAPRFQRTTIEANKQALTEALRAGEKDVPAEWSNAQPSLTIRVR